MTHPETTMEAEMASKLTDMTTLYLTETPYTAKFTESEHVAHKVAETLYPGHGHWVKVSRVQFPTHLLAQAMSAATCKNGSTGTHVGTVLSDKAWAEVTLLDELPRKRMETT